MTRDAPGSSLIGERVDGEPARAWRYSTDGAPSRAGGMELALWATNEIPVTSWFDVDLGLRATTTAASRNGEAGESRGGRSRRASAAAGASFLRIA